MILSQAKRYRTELQLVPDADASQSIGENEARFSSKTLQLSTNGYSRLCLVIPQSQRFVTQLSYRNTRPQDFKVSHTSYDLPSPSSFTWQVRVTDDGNLQTWESPDLWVQGWVDVALHASPNYS